MMIIFVLVLMVPAIIAGAAASILFDVAVRYGLFGRTADGTPPHVCKLYLSIVTIGFVATYVAFVISTHSETLIVIISSLLTVLTVVGIKFASMRCKSRRCWRRRAPRDPDNNPIAPTDAKRPALAPNA